MTRQTSNHRWCADSYPLAASEVNEEGLSGCPLRSCQLRARHEDDWTDLSAFHARSHLYLGALDNPFVANWNFRTQLVSSDNTYLHFILYLLFDILSIRKRLLIFRSFVRHKCEFSRYQELIPFSHKWMAISSAEPRCVSVGLIKV
jgi:hypothetical protein